MNQPTEDEEVQVQIDAWVTSQLPAASLEELTELENSHKARLRLEYGRLIDQSEAQFAALVDLIDHINFIERSDWPEHRYLQYVLLAHNLRPFSSTIDLLRKGHYEEATALLRILYETFLRAVFVSCYLDEPWGALAFKPPAGVTRFNVTSFVRDHLKLEWEKNYGILSVVTHSNTTKVISSLQRASEEDGPPERFGLRLAYLSRQVDTVAPFLQFILLAYLRFTRERLAGTALPHERLGRADTAIKWLTYGHTNHPQPYWQQVAADVDDLMAMLDIADNGGDWRIHMSSRHDDGDKS